MSLPIRITCDFELLRVTLKVLLIVIGGWLLIVTGSTLIEGHFQALAKAKFWFLMVLNTFPILALFLLPICFTPFIRPISRSRSALISQGFIILLLASLTYALTTYYILGHPSHTGGVYDKKGTTFFLTLIFVFLNAIIYLPSILKKSNKP